MECISARLGEVVVGIGSDCRVLGIAKGPVEVDRASDRCRGWRPLLPSRRLLGDSLHCRGLDVTSSALEENAGPTCLVRRLLVPLLLALFVCFAPCSS